MAYTTCYVALYGSEAEMYDCRPLCMHVVFAFRLCIYIYIPYVYGNLYGEVPELAHDLSVGILGHTI